MLFSYGQGEYIEGSKFLQGQIVLSEHKLYLRSEQGDLPQSYIPLEKIKRVKMNSSGIVVFVRPSIIERYEVLLKGQRKFLAELIKDLVNLRGFKKKFLKKEWFDVST